MDADEFSLDINTLVLVAVVVVLLWSVRTLFVYFFGASGPLMKNTYARLEANKKPEELIPAAERDVAVKRFWALVAILAVVWILFSADQEAFVQLVESVCEMIIDAAQWLAQAFRQFVGQVLQ
ncbi:MAG: hypothetical protein R6W76_17395 [Caldilinea sp.]